MAEVAATWEPIDSIQPWSKNPRKNDGEPVDRVAKSIQRFGFSSPIVCRAQDRRIIAGHTRWKAARKLGLTQVPVRFVPLDEAEAAALALADNKLTEVTPWDDEALAGVLRDLEAQSVDLDGLGWKSEEIDALIKGLDPEPPAASDDIPEVQAEVHSKPGEVYALGPHRLVCGDSTKAATWATLMGEERLRMVWTDPPYGVAYVGKTADAMTIENDTLDNAGLDVFLGLVFDEVLKVCLPGSAIYVAAPAGPRGVPFAVQLLARGMFRQRLVWVKNCMVLGHSDYHYRHEDIYFGYTPGTNGQGRLGRGGNGWFGGNAQTSVLEFDKPNRNGEHPTMKPIALVAKCIENSSKPGWLVGEPFGGSGTTLLACAQTGRVARVIELDPRYCDVIRRRWTRYAKEAGIDPGEGALDG